MKYSFEENIDTEVLRKLILGVLHIKDCLILLNSDPIESKYLWYQFEIYRSINVKLHALHSGPVIIWGPSLAW
jgi:hypothetical protein